MALVTINGVSGYVTKTSGKLSYFIRENAPTSKGLKFLADADTNKGVDTLEDYLKTLTYTSTGRNAWSHFEGYVEVYDSTLDDLKASVGDAFAVVDTSVGMTQAELDDLIVRVNALQDIVKRFH